MAELSPGQSWLAVVDLCQGHCKNVYISVCSAFPGLGNGRQKPPDNSSYLRSQALLPRHSFLTTLPCHPRAPWTWHRCGCGHGCAAFISSSRHYSPRHGASTLTRWYGCCGRGLCQDSSVQQYKEWMSVCWWVHVLTGALYRSPEGTVATGMVWGGEAGEWAHGEMQEGCMWLGCVDLKRYRHLLLLEQMSLFCC